MFNRRRLGGLSIALLRVGRPVRSPTAMRGHDATPVAIRCGERGRHATSAGVRKYPSVCRLMTSCQETGLGWLVLGSAFHPRAVIEQAGPQVREGPDPDISAVEWLVCTRTICAAHRLCMARASAQRQRSRRFSSQFIADMMQTETSASRMMMANTPLVLKLAASSCRACPRPCSAAMISPPTTPNSE